jgi:hypothetical protein
MLHADSPAFYWDNDDLFVVLTVKQEGVYEEPAVRSRKKKSYYDLLDS